MRTHIEQYEDTYIVVRSRYVLMVLVLVARVVALLRAAALLRSTK
jgi:hypothetical protein